MKKSLLALTAALSFGFAAAQDTAPAAPAAQVPALTDVPAGHWAKDAIDKLVSQGIILGYPDGTFRGTQNLTRYEAAVIIARLLNQMGTAQAPVLDAETMTSLQNAIQELAADLAALGVRVSDLEENAVTKDDFARLEQRVEQLGSMTPAPTDTAAPAPFDNSANEQTQADLQDQVSTVQDQVSTNTDDIATNGSAIADLQGQISDFTTRADDLQANYDTLRADVDDNASSIAALNDLTVLLNQDILNLQDRASAIEAAQADFVQRADFDNLVGRVAVTETKITDFGNRISALEKNAFSIKPTLTATYFVARADREMDIDRLFPGTKFSTGDDGDSATTDTPVDYVDLGNNQTKVVNNANGLYGFSTDTYTYAVVLTNPTANTNKTVTYTAARGTQPAYTISAADTALGFTQAGTPVEVGTQAVNSEGATTLDFGIDFSNKGAFSSGTSANTGAYLTSAGGVTIKSVDVQFGITANPSLTGTQTASDLAHYPAITDSNGYTYEPLFFYFKNGTAVFTVGNSPVTVDFGRSLKTKFSDYIFDNNLDGRGDGYAVTVDGSNLPVLGAFKPIIKAIYGSSNLTYDATGANVHATTGANGDYRYYRGVRAEITPIGTLKLGLNYAQEGRDTVGTQLAINGVQNVVAYGADAHGGLFGFQIDSEYARSTVTGTPTDNSTTQRTATAFYGKASGAVGPVRVYDLNYRSIGAGYDKYAAISEANPGDTTNGSTTPYNRGDRAATYLSNGVYVAQDPTPGQVGAGAEVGGALGPVAVGGYYNTQTIEGGSLGQKDANGIVDFGVTAKVNLLNLVTVRGGYYGLYAGAQSADVSNSVKGDGTRYGVRADVTPGLGLSIGAFYRDLSLSGNRAQNDVLAYDAAGDTSTLFANSRYGAYYMLAGNTLTNQSGCGAQHPGTGLTDTDAVGGALTFSLAAFSDATCYSEYGAEIMHDGALPTALVKNLTLRFGYAARYRNATSSYSGSALYADGLYNAKLGFLNANIKALYNSTGFDQGSEPTVADVRTIAAGAKVSTDTLDTIFKPSVEGQVGYLSRNYSGTSTANGDYDVSGLSYRAGIKLHDFLLPTGQLAVYYAGLNAKNRAYTPWTNSTDNTAGSYGDQNTGTTINQNGLYVEGNYYDLSFAYGLYNLSAVDTNGNQVALPNGQAAKGSTFKITYKVGF
ncbi:S-layer homology domain-containing protein [Deinococcus rubellus]|uniref:S-layer homology domain-containing protein n=1 Tax=Deinococcus rubellus TaxID=1889240 RepID=A0ABY5YHS9_9DEIO|nr:S-layer homology domain-containing protein [Deinococcus rubellus]UWX63834.1 S-layer homology domain-containing protein [Deinococcus rubellus]